MGNPTGNPDELDIQLRPKPSLDSGDIEIELKPQGRNINQEGASLGRKATAFCVKCGAASTYGAKLCERCSEEPINYPALSSPNSTQYLPTYQQTYSQPYPQQLTQNYPTYETPQQYQSQTHEEAIRCPRCGSQHISYERSGYGWGKGMIGAVLLGPIGLLGGMIGSKKIRITCIKCGNYWIA